MKPYLTIKYENRIINLKLITPINHTSLTILEENKFMVNEYFTFKSSGFELYNVRSYNDLFKNNLAYITEFNLVLSDFYDYVYLPNKNEHVYFNIANPYFFKEYKIINNDDKINETIEL